MIRIQIVTENWNPISAAIRFSTRSWASHIEFIDLAAGVTLGARSKGGVQLRDARKDHYSRIEQFTFIGIDKAYEWAKTQIGKPYDYSAILGMATNRDWHNESKWFCSEFTAVAAEKVGYPVLSTRPSAAPYRITPRDWLLSRLIFYLPTIMV
jgi:uncharacterized protein YycO